MTPGSGYGLKADDGPVDISKLKLTTIAKRITSAMKKLEADDEWNRGEGEDLAAEPRRKLYKPTARRGQRSAILISHVSFQGPISYPKAEAVAYLEWLEAGNKGTMFEFKRLEKS